MNKNIVSLLVFLAAVILTGMFGSAFPPGEWYAGMVKPSWNPPDWLFGPVWTLLYLLMAVAAWRVWLRAAGSVRRGAIVWWVIQLVLNGLWSWLFFGLHRIGWALAELGLLWVAILFTFIAFRSIDRLAGLLLLPYLAWVSFAAVLNFSLWSLNGGGI